MSVKVPLHGLAPSRYDVFLSYHDKDLGKSFASDLYSALTNAGFVVYMNNHNQTNFSAIEASGTSIIIFSSNFDASTWFLEELEKILECCRSTGQVVVPVYYGVDDSDVRHQRGSFGKVTKSYESIRYRAAFLEAAQIPGFDIGNSSRPPIGGRVGWVVPLRLRPIFLTAHGPGLERVKLITIS
ncbi:TMV resistance protein N-like [Trifolium medium]|uniref:TMV resistance protein N-like n=1 Tax=Trifolium medium TaxID=97028 RepID=A0A392MKV5_9FABA|nr:TMV resistance protein N-like [Trifolium medium]